ncbi:hypothetical protein Tco_0368676 [Tanacetum coccineum]
MDIDGPSDGKCSNRFQAIQNIESEVILSIPMQDRYLLEPASNSFGFLRGILALIPGFLRGIPAPLIVDAAPLIVGREREREREGGREREGKIKREKEREREGERESTNSDTRIFTRNTSSDTRIFKRKLATKNWRK